MGSTVPILSYQQQLHSQAVSTQIISSSTATPTTTVLRYDPGNVSVVKKSLKCRDYFATITTFIAIFGFVLSVTIILSRTVSDYTASTQPENCLVWTNVNLTGIHLKTRSLGLGDQPKCLMWRASPLDSEEDKLDLGTIIAVCVIAIVVVFLAIFIIVGLMGKECAA